ncbi:TetR/AcrR family transcriptional regulator, partial [Vibrio parahaemolyticus]|uniref:TetR/AcrR family transcriptional regulator n=1 Tax=Vibrio parahaemolyticus TaxID=670 RepID=UPI00146C549C
MNVKRKSRSETKREAILCAARQAFQEFGVQNTSMDKLSAIAQVSKRTVYNHFPSKEAIVTELLTELWRSSMMESDIKRLATLPLKDQLIELLYSEIIVVTEPNYIELAKGALGQFLFKPEDLKEQAEQMSTQETALD